MQFGRIVGAGLALLGILLLFLEFGFFLNRGRLPARRENGREFDRREQFERQSHRVPMLPGVLGGAFVIGGAVVFLMARMEDEPNRKSAIK